MKKTILSTIALMALTTGALAHTPNYGEEITIKTAKEILTEIGNKNREIKLLENAEYVTLRSNTLTIVTPELIKTLDIEDSYSNNQPEQKPVTTSELGSTSLEEDQDKLEMAQNCDENAQYMCAKSLYSQLGMRDKIEDITWEQAHELANQEKPNYSAAAKLLKYGGFPEEGKRMYAKAADIQNDKGNYPLASKYYQEAEMEYESQEAKETHKVNKQWYLGPENATPRRHILRSGGKGY